jgi:hypothetical protein
MELVEAVNRRVKTHSIRKTPWGRQDRSLSTVLLWRGIFTDFLIFPEISDVLGRVPKSGKILRN